jgi:branched-chain amino acid transport system ATP-binding protein
MLAIEDITVTYAGAIPAVQGVSLEVPDRGVVALLGANGAGKTTILRAITGLLRFHGAALTSGAIRFEGKRIDRLDATRIVRLGIAQVLEGRRPFAELSVEENLRAGAVAARDATSARFSYERVMELFPILRERRHSAAGYLSGGEQQMLAIGRALMSRPRLLLLDEPSLGLAPLIARQIFGAISKLNREEKLTVFLVEQNAFHALNLAHRGYVMVNGLITLHGTGRELLERPEVKSAYLEGGRH